MDFKHPLLVRATKYRVKRVDLSPPNCTYDVHIGAWRINDSGALWAESKGRIGPNTKKGDVETGEDQKGE